MFFTFPAPPLWERLMFSPSAEKGSVKVWEGRNLNNNLLSFHAFLGDCSTVPWCVRKCFTVRRPTECFTGGGGALTL
jgi:hypothetical protein